MEVLRPVVRKAVPQLGECTAVDAHEAKGGAPCGPVLADANNRGKGQDRLGGVAMRPITVWRATLITEISADSRFHTRSRCSSASNADPSGRSPTLSKRGCELSSCGVRIETVALPILLEKASRPSRVTATMCDP